MSLESESPETRRYRVTLTQTAVTTVDIEAENSTEAVEEAEMTTFVGLCRDCSRNVTIDAIAWVPDGEAEIIP